MMIEPDTETQSQPSKPTNSAPVPNGDAQSTPMPSQSPASLKAVETNCPVPSKQAGEHDQDASTVFIDDDDDEDELEQQEEIHDKTGQEELERNDVKMIESFDIPDTHQDGKYKEHNLNNPGENVENLAQEHNQDKLGPAFTSMSTIDDADTRIEAVDMNNPNTDEPDAKNEDEKGDIDFKAQNKVGPSSALTAVEWDGGITLEDVHESFDDDEDADPEYAEEEATEPTPRFEKGKGRAVPIQTELQTQEQRKSSELKKDRKSLKLIDLPLDVLKEIIREVTNTTDLCSLSLAHTSLHNLAIPHIYSRFDIVWPDLSSPSERTGVDALTYGLATLVSPRNYYAQYVRKFSLGNGPKEWVNEYAITKEGGKMLGTLVSLALHKMTTLETFSWDMPTGVLRDVWMALHGLENIKNIHVRWHDNTHTEVLGSQDISRRIERPNLSGFKNLKSLSVLDLDEVAYLRELAIAIDQSFTTLRELRLGVATHAQSQRWVNDDESDISPVATGDGVGEGGVVGLAVSKICDMKRKPKVDVQPAAQNSVPPHVNQDALTQEQLAQLLQSKQQQEKQEVETTPATTSSATSIRIFGKDEEDDTVPVKQLKLDVLELERVPISTRVLVKAFDFTTLTSLTLINCTSHSKLFKVLRRKFSPYPILLNKMPKATTKPPSPILPPLYRLHLKKIHTDTVSTSLLTFINHTLAPNTLEVLFLQETSQNDYNSMITLSAICLGPMRRHRLSLKKLLIDSYVTQPDSVIPNASGPASMNKKSKWKFNRETISFVVERMPALRELSFAIDYKDWHFFLTRLPELKNLRSLYIPHVISLSANEEVHKPERQAEEMAMQIVDVVTLRPESSICYVGIINKCYEFLEGDDSPNHAGDDSSHLGNGEVPGLPIPNNVMSDDEDDDEDDDVDDDDDDEEDDGDEEDGDDTEDADDLESDQENADGTGVPPTIAGMMSGNAHGGHGAMGMGIGGGGVGTSGVTGGAGKTDDLDAGAEEGRIKRIKVRHREILFYDDKVAVFKARFAKL